MRPVQSGLSQYTTGTSREGLEDSRGLTAQAGAARSSAGRPAAKTAQASAQGSSFTLARAEKPSQRAPREPVRGSYQYTGTRGASCSAVACV